MKYRYFLLIAAILTIFTQCDTIKNLPTNTSGGVISLNGSWQLTSTTDNGAMVGTVVQVFPGISNAAVKTLGNNTYCLRDRDVLWRNLKAGENGTFSLETLVNACNNTSVYKPAIITAVNNDEISIATQSVNNTELVQVWQRARNQ